MKKYLLNGKTVELTEEQAKELGATTIESGSASGKYWTRPEGKDYLEEFRKENGSFDDFNPCSVTEKKKFTSKRKGTLMVVLSEKANGEIHLTTAESLSALQDNNPERPLLVNANNEIAKVGESCIVNENELIGREDGTLMLG